MKRWIKEAWLVLSQCIHMLLRNVHAIILFTFGAVILTAMLLCMEEEKEEKGRISVGIADEDNSLLSQNVIKKMQQMELYEITTGKEKELLSELKTGEITAVCVIKKDFADNVIQGKTKNLVTIYETKERGAWLLGDIFAGAMMQEVCEAKSYLTLLSYEEKAGKERKSSLAEYRDYVEKIREEATADFSFEVNYVDSEKAVNEPTITMIYEQAIVAVLAMMTGVLSLYTVLPFRSIKLGHTANRLKTLPLRKSAVYAGGGLSAALIPVLFAGFFIVCFGMKNKVGILQIISLLICTMVYVCVIVCMMLIAAGGIRNQSVYQMGMLAMILIFGVFGLVSLVDGLLLPKGMVKWIPNAWYVRKVTEILYQ